MLVFSGSGSTVGAEPVEATEAPQAIQPPATPVESIA